MAEGLRWMIIVLLAAALACACSACAGDDDDNGDDDDDQNPYVPPTQACSYYEEYRSEDWLSMEEHLPLFAERGLILVLAMPVSSIGDPDLRHLLLAAAELGVEVRCWVLLPVEDGYWAGESNAEVFARAARAFADWFLAERIPIHWICVDMEMNIHTHAALVQAIGEGRLLDAAFLLLENLDPERFEQAARVYQELVDELNALGFYVMVGTYPQILDDLADGDTFLQDLLDVPVSPVAWDEVSTMVYRSHYEDYTGLSFGPYLVYDYARSTALHFGSAASIGLGVVRNMNDPYRLAAEVGAARAAGVELIQVYSFIEVASRPDAELWHAAFDAPPAIPAPEPMVDLMRGALRLADALF